MNVIVLENRAVLALRRSSGCRFLAFKRWTNDLKTSPTVQRKAESCNLICGCVIKYPFSSINSSERNHWCFENHQSAGVEFVTFSRSVLVNTPRHRNICRSNILPIGVLSFLFTSSLSISLIWLYKEKIVNCYESKHFAFITASSEIEK